MSDTREPGFEATPEAPMARPPDDGGAAQAGAESAPPPDARPRARLLPMWILLAAVVIVGVAWAMSERYFGAPEAETDVPLIGAEETPVKVRPKEPGGVEVPDRDKYVYKSLTDAEPEAEQLLPPPEEPMARPPVEALEREVPAPPPPDELALAEAAAARQTEAAEQGGAVSQAAPPEGASESVSESVSEEVQAVQEAAETVAAVEVPEAVVEKAEIEKPESGRAAEPAAEPAAPVASGQGGAPSADGPAFRLQIGATRNEAAAKREVLRLAKLHPKILGRLNAIVVRADLGAKGVWYRLRVGPFAGRAEAAAVCGRLKAVDVGCFIVAD